MSSLKAWSVCFSHVSHRRSASSPSHASCVCVTIMMTRTTLLPRTLCVSLLSKHSCSFIAPTIHVPRLQQVTDQHLPPCAFSRPYNALSSFLWKQVELEMGRKGCVHLCRAGAIGCNSDDLSVRCREAKLTLMRTCEEKHKATLMNCTCC